MGFTIKWGDSIYFQASIWSVLALAVLCNSLILVFCCQHLLHTGWGDSNFSMHSPRLFLINSCKAWSCSSHFVTMRRPNKLIITTTITTKMLYAMNSGAKKEKIEKTDSALPSLSGWTTPGITYTWTSLINNKCFLGISQGYTNFFSKGSDSKYFRFVGHLALTAGRKPDSANIFSTHLLLSYNLQISLWM